MCRPHILPEDVPTNLLNPHPRKPGDKMRKLVHCNAPPPQSATRPTFRVWNVCNNFLSGSLTTTIVVVAAVGKVGATVTKTAIRENVLVISFFFFFCSGCRKSAVFCFQVNHYYQCISRRTIAMVVAAI